MADTEVDLFGGHEVIDETTDEAFPLIPTGRDVDDYNVDTTKHETSFGGTETRLRNRFLKTQVKDLYEELSHRLQQNPEIMHTDLFEISDGELYYRDNSKPLTINGRLTPIGSMADILGKKGLRNLGFDIAKSRFLARQATMLNKIEKELPSISKITKASDAELENLTDMVTTNVEEMIHMERDIQTGDLFEYPLREVLGLDKELKNIRGSLASEVAKKFQLEQHIEKEKGELEEIVNDTIYTDEERDRVKDRMKKLANELKVSEESIDILKGKLNSQVRSIRETIVKVFDKDTTLREKVQTLFRKQGITIVSILTAFGMIIGFLVEALLPLGGGSTSHTNPHKSGDDNKDSVAKWIKNKLKALASLLGKLASKTVSALPGIIVSIVSWILNRAIETVGCLSKNL